MTHVQAIPYALLAGTPNVSGELASLLTPLLTQRSRRTADELLRCLRAYLDAGARSARAATLAGVSRRTLERRLKQVRELTGCYPDDGTVWVTLYLALRALELSDRHPWRPPLPSPERRARGRAHIAAVPDPDDGPPNPKAS
jgi:hypothetical protein